MANLATSQDLTASLADVGTAQTLSGETRKSVVFDLNYTPNDSLGGKVALLVKNPDGIWELLQKKNKSNSRIDTEDLYVYLNSGDNKIYFNISTETIEFKLQTIAETVGSTAGVINTAYGNASRSEKVGEEIVETQDVAVQDQTTPIVDYYFTQCSDTDAPSADVAIDDREILAPTTMNFVAGDIIELSENGRFYQARVLSVAIGAPDDTVTVDTPFDYAYTTAGIVERCSNNLNVDGSVTTQVFSIRASANVEWDITRIILNMTDATTMDSAKFGGIAGGLTNGIVIRRKNGVYHNIFNAKTNGELAVRMFDIIYGDKAPAGVYEIRGRRSFNGQDKNGVAVRLTGNDNDELQIIIQDNLTGLTSFTLIGQGHKTDE